MNGGTVTTRVWFLEMTSADALVPPRRAAPEALVLAQVSPIAAAYVRFFYGAVGRDYAWNDRMAWTEEEWENSLDRPGVQLLTASLGGAPAGFALLAPGTDTDRDDASAGDAPGSDSSDAGDVEVAYFGLLPGWTGRGVGGALLHRAVNLAWTGGARRVWLHTCSLDSPAARPAYEKRGFRVYRETTREQRLIDRGSW